MRLVGTTIEPGDSRAREGLADFVADDGVVLVAEEDGRVVGAASLLLKRMNPMDATPGAWLDAVDKGAARLAEVNVPGEEALGVGVVVRGEHGASRRIWVPADGALVAAAPGLPPIPIDPALLSLDAMAEAALVLRRPVASAPAPTAGAAPVDVATAIPSAPTPSLQAEAEAAGPQTEVDGAAIRLLCLGGVRVMLGGEPVEGGWRRKALELLALLASNPEGLTREKVLDALWPEDPPSKTGDRLRQCLRQIRQRLGAGAGTAVADWVDDRLRLDEAAVWSDVGAVRDIFVAGRSDAMPKPDINVC